MSIVFSLTREHDDWLTLNYCYCTVTLTATCRWPSCNHLPVLGADCPLITITGCSIGNGSGHCPQPMSSNICLSLIDMRRFPVTHTAFILPLIPLAFTFSSFLVFEFFVSVTPDKAGLQNWTLYQTVCPRYVQYSECVVCECVFEYVVSVCKCSEVRVSLMISHYTTPWQDKTLLAPCPSDLRRLYCMGARETRTT